MKTFKTHLLLAGILALPCGSALVRAADQVPQEKKAAQAGKALTEESLHGMIKGMGYEPKIEKTAQGNIYTLTIKRGTWTYILDVSLSPSKTKLWFSGWLGTLPADEKVATERLLKLLEGSWTHGPYHFRYHRAFKQLNLGLCLDNRDMTPAAVRAQLEDFMAAMKKTEDLWNVRKWNDAPKGAPSPKVEALKQVEKKP